MADWRLFVVPGALLAASAAYIALNVSGTSLEPLPTPTSTATPWPTYTRTPTATPVPATLDLQGTLVWEASNPLFAAIEFPSGAAVRAPLLDQDAADRSHDGAWKSTMLTNVRGEWEMSFHARDGRSSRVEGDYIFAVDMRWAPASNAYAFGVADDAAAASASRILVVEDPAAPEPVTAYTAPPGSYASAFAWYGDELIVAQEDGASTSVVLASLDGTRRSVGDIALTDGRSVGDIALTDGRYLDASPNGHAYAFVVESPDGWRLMTIEVLPFAVIDHGTVLSEAPACFAVRPRSGPFPPGPFENGGGPANIAWSPDGSKLAFGAGTAPPYTLTTVDLNVRSATTTEFPSAYAGDITWSPDSSSIAVTTYGGDPAHHEVSVIDPATGGARLLMAGCKVVWSPDSRFLAVGAEDVTGIAVVEAASGERMQLTGGYRDAPVRWTQ